MSGGYQSSLNWIGMTVTPWWWRRRRPIRMWWWWWVWKSEKWEIEAELQNYRFDLRKESCPAGLFQCNSSEWGWSKQGSHSSSCDCSFSFVIKSSERRMYWQKSKLWRVKSRRNGGEDQTEIQQFVKKNIKAFFLFYELCFVSESGDGEVGEGREGNIRKRIMRG